MYECMLFSSAEMLTFTAGVGSSDRKMNLETEIPVMTHCKEPALTSKMTLTFFESVNGLILY